MPKSLPALLLLFSLPLLLSAQAIYSGRIQDVANGHPVAGVNIALLNSSVEQTSNLFGDFVLKNTAHDSLIHPRNSYRFYNNTMLWEGEFPIELEIYAIDGRLVRHESNLGNAGSYLFPKLPFGIYLLRVSTEEDIQTFKAFSNGDRTSIADRGATWHRSSVVPQPDTLLLSKEGYYSRLIPLAGKDTLLRINLLKKENDDLHYFNELIDPIAFDLISNRPSRTNDGEVSSVKIIYNQEDGLMYYMNTKRYTLHYLFAKAQLGFDQGNSVFNQTQYRRNDDRYLFPANLNYYKDQDKYVLYFVAANEISCEEIQLLFDKILSTSYLEGRLFLFANRPEFNTCDVPQITPEELYEGQNYQALNLAENYGYLNKVPLEDLEDTYLGRHDIILLNGIPNDVSVVAGIITTEFQTPLSHINVLSHNRNTPNMALRDGWGNQQLDALLGRLVYLKVSADSFEIRPATLPEATAFWAQNEPQDSIILDKNTTLQGLVDLQTADYSFVDVVGGKASNFAEILNTTVSGVPIPTPESSFAIPFYYYDKHLKDAGLDVFLEEMLVNEQFINNPAYRRARLKDFQERIKDEPLDAELIGLVEDRIHNFADFPSFRFRSSTNAEDLENFSGAGLYSSYSAKANDPDKTIEKAIKKVWASLWNWRAFEERSYYKISHTSCAMGILVHRSFPDEDANGVVITKNLYNTNPGFIINVQYKEYSIVFPEPGILNDQIMLFTWSIVPGQQFTPEYLTFSNIPELNGQTVLTDDELMELGAYCLALKKHFYQNVPHDCNCTEQDFGLDIEFKVDSQVSQRKIYIKQARLYN
ncbi:MAG: PEP/pyruvate-binding domain-containing protein [Lewinella sp.]|uniref:PEP/pyruvate-binding domain-containing protein n=1 Tax=Lewinella sp. TaxID=2004506 RepID=UPI003D6A703D